MGNLRSVQKAFEKNGNFAMISNQKDIIQNADKIVLPGVGSFKDGMKNLLKLGLVDILNKEVVEKKKPFLGICLGMQLLATKSFENGETKGLNFISGKVVKFEDSNLKVPHVGWNNIIYTNNQNRLFESINNNSDFYFVHSYHFKSDEKDAVTSFTEYGLNFISSINKDNIYAFQFHPEKSQTAGLQIIKNYVNLELKC